MAIPFGKGLGNLPADYYLFVVHAYAEPVYHVLIDFKSGPGWNRTNDQGIMSPLL
jgi:hypothetical protein